MGLTWLYGYDSIWMFMNLFTLLSRYKKEEAVKTIAEYQREMLVRQTEKQFRKLQELGLSVPVAAE